MILTINTQWQYNPACQVFFKWSWAFFDCVMWPLTHRLGACDQKDWIITLAVQTSKTVRYHYGFIFFLNTKRKIQSLKITDKIHISWGRPSDCLLCSLQRQTHTHTHTYKCVLSAGMVAVSPTANQNARYRAPGQWDLCSLRQPSCQGENKSVGGSVCVCVCERDRERVCMSVCTSHTYQVNLSWFNEYLWLYFSFQRRKSKRIVFLKDDLLLYAPLSRLFLILLYSLLFIDDLFSLITSAWDPNIGGVQGQLLELTF